MKFNYCQISTNKVSFSELTSEKGHSYCSEDSFYYNHIVKGSLFPQTVRSSRGKTTASTGEARTAFARFIFLANMPAEHIQSKPAVLWQAADPLQVPKERHLPNTHSQHNPIIYVASTQWPSELVDSLNQMTVGSSTFTVGVGRKR